MHKEIDMNYSIRLDRLPLDRGGNFRNVEITGIYRGFMTVSLWYCLVIISRPRRLHG